MGKFFLYGGNSGKTSAINTHGTELTISYGEDIDGITSGGTKYGGKGKHSQTVTMPADSVFQIVEMQTHAQRVLGYLKLIISGRTYEFGTRKSEVYLNFSPPLNARISDICYDESRITGIRFESDFD